MRIVCCCGWKSTAGESHIVAHELDQHHADVQGITVAELRKRTDKAINNFSG
jgi:hypothetical protein